MRHLPRRSADHQGPPGGGEGRRAPRGPGSRRSRSRRRTLRTPPGGQSATDGIDQFVDRVDELAEPAVVELVEPQGEAGEIEVVVVRPLGREWPGGPDDPARHDVREPAVEIGQLPPVGCDGHPDHQEVADPPARAVVPVEGEECMGGGVDVVGEREERAVVCGDQTAGLDLVAEEPVPPLPVGAAGHVQHDHRSRLGLAGLEQGEQLEPLVERAEPAGQDHVPVGLLDEHELAGEEVAHLDQLGVLGDERVGPLFVREPDVDPDRLLAARALHPGGHDPRAGTGDHHPPGTGHGGCQVPCLPVRGVLGLGPGRAEDGHLLAGAVGTEHPECLGHLGQRGVGHLEIDHVGILADQRGNGCQHRPVEAPSGR